MNRRWISAAAGTAALTLALAGCVGASGSGGSGEGASGTGDPFAGDVTGTITVLTNRTDLVDTTLQDYSTAFAEKYPGTTVEWEAVTNYEDDVSIRLNSDDYGDVLLIPNKVSKDQLPQFFEPLGSVDELGKTYRFVEEQAFDGTVYGLATFGTAQGYVFNRAVWEAAGITEPPATPEAFLDALEAIKATGAIPYYTNYADGWPLTQWQSNQGEIAGPEAVQLRDASDAPWAEGEEQGTIDRLLFDIVAGGYAEKDPTTTNWEESKNLLGTGKVATMVLGSWAVPQMQDAAEKAGGSKDDIGYWPMPWKTDGAFRSTVGGDYKIAVSTHSSNKATAKAFVDWFLDESGFAAAQGGLPARIDGETPASLADFEAFGVETVELAPAPEGQESLDSDIYNAAEIDLTGPNYKKQLVDVARGAASGDKASFFTDLDERWAAARAEVSGS